MLIGWNDYFKLLFCPSGKLMLWSFIQSSACDKTLQDVFKFLLFPQWSKFIFNLCLLSLPYLDVGISDRNLRDVASGFLNCTVSNFGSAGFLFLRRRINSYSKLIHLVFTGECSPFWMTSPLS